MTDELVELACNFPAVLQSYREIASSYFNEDASDDRRNERIGRLLRSLRNVPMYRRYDLGDHEIRDSPVAVLERLPMCTKAIIRDNYEDHVSDALDPKECVWTATSGTTGTPLRVILSRDHMIQMQAMTMYRYLHVFGIGYHAKVLQPFCTWLDGWNEFTSVNNALSRWAEFGCARRDTAKVAALVNRSAEFQPQALVAHPTQIRDYVDQLQLTDLLPKLMNCAVLTTGERLTHDTRRSIEERLNTRVFDSYAMTEFGSIATQCEAGTYHIDTDRLHVEIVGSSPGTVDRRTAGEIVVTGLTNLAMPLVRFRTGDFGTMALESCACGDHRPRLVLREGRDVGTISFPEEPELQVASITRLIRRFDVRQYQVLQPAPNEIVVQLLPGGSWRSSDIIGLVAAVQQAVPTSVSVSVREVERDDFITSRSGKPLDFVRTSRP